MISIKINIILAVEENNLDTLSNLFVKDKQYDWIGDGRHVIQPVADLIKHIECL